uniref:Uncharacterized protein n=1 Tax=Anguilla anguilla TaxID=7936 RepID=A0A0E9REZ6_ANGAN
MESVLHPSELFHFVKLLYHFTSSDFKISCAQYAIP